MPFHTKIPVYQSLGLSNKANEKRLKTAAFWVGDVRFTSILSKEGLGSAFL